MKAFTEVLNSQPHPTHATLLRNLTKWIAQNVHEDLWQTSKPQLGSVCDIAMIRDTVFDM